MENEKQVGWDVKEIGMSNSKKSKLIIYHHGFAGLTDLRGKAIEIEKQDGTGTVTQYENGVKKSVEKHAANGSVQVELWKNDQLEKTQHYDDKDRHHQTDDHDSEGGTTRKTSKDADGKAVIEHLDKHGNVTHIQHHRWGLKHSVKKGSEHHQHTASSHHHTSKASDPPPAYESKNNPHVPKARTPPPPYTPKSESHHKRDQSKDGKSHDSVGKHTDSHEAPGTESGGED